MGQWLGAGWVQYDPGLGGCVQAVRSPEERRQVTGDPTGKTPVPWAKSLSWQAKGERVQWEKSLSGYPLLFKCNGMARGGGWKTGRGECNWEERRGCIRS